MNFATDISQVIHGEESIPSSSFLFPDKPMYCRLAYSLGFQNTMAVDMPPPPFTSTIQTTYHITTDMSSSLPLGAETGTCIPPILPHIAGSRQSHCSTCSSVVEAMVAFVSQVTSGLLQLTDQFRLDVARWEETQCQESFRREEAQLQWEESLCQEAMQREQSEARGPGKKIEWPTRRP